MITDIFFYIIELILRLIFFILPNWDFPAIAYTSLAESLELIYGLNVYLPIDTLFEVFKWALYFEISLMIFKQIMKYVTIARGGGTA